MMTKKEIFNILNSTSENIKDNVGTVLKIVHLAIVKTDSYNVVHFITEDKKHYASIAKAVNDAARILLDAGFEPSENEPVEIVFVEREYAEGTYITFEMVW